MSSTTLQVRSLESDDSRRRELWCRQHPPANRSRVVWLVFVVTVNLLTAASGRADKPAYTVEADPGISCRMRPEEVAHVVPDGKITSMRCTTLDIEHDARRRLTVWWVAFGDQRYCVDDTTGKIMGFSGTGFPTTARRPTPEKPPLPYKVEIDPGVSCHMKPEEVADGVKDEKIVSMHCTILETGKIGTPQRQTVWTVSLGDHGYTVDDATGKIIGHGGVGFPTMGVSPHPQPVQAPR